MAYKTVRRNGRDVLINTATGKEVRPGERVANELRYVGQGITDNFTYSDKVDARSGRRLTPKEVRTAEGTKPKASKPAAKPAAKSTAKAPRMVTQPLKKGTSLSSRMVIGQKLRSLQQPNRPVPLHLAQVEAVHVPMPHRLHVLKLHQ